VRSYNLHLLFVSMELLVQKSPTSKYVLVEE
jgi:hypothetical protein